jgi:hypothetical protein
VKKRDKNEQNLSSNQVNPLYKDISELKKQSRKEREKCIKREKKRNNTLNPHKKKNFYCYT